ncbi:MAG: hypothetical protein DIU71_04330 [Proteobacteria bacterium]|nr:MAG: hypothetical protein DIU71_04330 [Pseudomonadota bacterium]
MNKRSNARAEQLRRVLAQEAARIMSEQGIDDFARAKRKAAERLGATDKAVLPKNVEIEAALAEHQRLFESQTHSSVLTALRRTALEAMRLLKRFEPRLVGPVLTGTASAHSEVNLHLFADHSESVALHLMEQGIPHRIAERRMRYEPGRLVSYPAVRFVAGDREIDAVIFPVDGIRQSPSSPVDGRPMRRADTAELESLLAAQA